MHEVSISLTVSDLVDQSVTCRIVNVTSSEPEDGDGDGNTEPDWEYSGLPGDLTLKLRAERSGAGDGRIYTVQIECVDDFGNVTNVWVEVPVAHDQGTKPDSSLATVWKSAVVAGQVAPGAAGTGAPNVDGTGDESAMLSGGTSGTVDGQTTTTTGGTTAGEDSITTTGADGPIESPTGTAGTQAGVTNGGEEFAGTPETTGPEPTTTKQTFDEEE